MKINELIEKLEEMKQKHGDVDVSRIDENCDCVFIEDIKFIEEYSAFGVDFPDMVLIL